MQIKLYKYSGKENQIDKVLDDATAQTLNGVLFDYFDTIKPRIKARQYNGLTDLKTFNYCVISELDKSYFIDNITIVSNDVVTFDLRLDVLQTYAAEIKAATVTVISKENANGYISNRETVYNVLPNIQKLNFSENTPFDENGVIIMVALKGKL